MHAKSSNGESSSSSVQNRVVQKFTKTGETQEEYQTHDIFSSGKTTAWSHDMKVHAEKCVERNFESAETNVPSLQQVARPGLDDHLIPQEDFETNGELLCVSANRSDIFCI